MNKKTQYFVLTVALCFFIMSPVFALSPVFAESQSNPKNQKKAAERDLDEYLKLKESIEMRRIHTIKFELQHIQPEEFLKVAKIYFQEATFYKNKIIVKIMKRDIQKFEKLLSEMDVKRKTIQFRIYNITAFSDKLPGNHPIKNKDLKKVIDELSSLWNFKTYDVDDPFYITLQEGSGPNSFLLEESSNLLISNVNVKGEKKGQRTIHIKQLKLEGDAISKKIVFFDTYNLTLNENGYFVAGITKLGSKKAWILILHAEIK